MRWLVTALILALLGLDLALPATGLGRRGSETRVRSDAADAVLSVGDRLPPLEFVGLAGETLRTESLLGHRVLLTFERSVDW